MIITLGDAVAFGRGVERPFNCPTHDDSNASASVNVLKGVWFCYVCHSHGALEDHVPTIDEAVAILAGEKSSRIYPEAWLDVYDADHSSPYWVHRFGYAVASANRCGTDPMTGAPTYPIRDDQGRLVGVVSRHENVAPKYQYPFNTSTSRTLYGVVKVAPVLVLVEGAGDVMAIEQGRPPEHWGIGGTYGAGLHFPQVELVARRAPQVVVAAFDDDKAGRMAIERAQAVLGDLVPVVSHHWSSVGGKDAGEVPPSTRIESIAESLRSAGYGKFI